MALPSVGGARGRGLQYVFVMPFIMYAIPLSIIYIYAPQTHFPQLPIRRRSHHNSARTLELIRKDLECVSLVFPNVSFSLENTAKERSEGSGRGRIMTIPKVCSCLYASRSVLKPRCQTSSTLSAFRHLFGRALCEVFIRILVTQRNLSIFSEQHVENINVSMGDMRIQGFLSLEGAQSKASRLNFPLRCAVLMSRHYQAHQYLCTTFSSHKWLCE
jgi:hypothetical protein